jgi:hypothetical protein
MDRDLSAQGAHAQLAEQHWPALLNLTWYGGFDPLGYSVLSPPVMALLGVRLTTALAWSPVGLPDRRNPIFYDGTLNADTYRKWLDDNAISYVAISHGPYDWAASREATFVRGGLPYLQAVWSDQTWTLYAVTNPRPVISPPGRLSLVIPFR